MALTNPNDIVTEERLSEFYQGILPYLGAVHGSPPKPVVVYGMRILRDESIPSDKVVYLEDAVGMTPAHMDYTNNVFDYGSWEDAFFMPKPCMLKYDGTVDYYLDPNDYTKKEDGTASDVANTSYGGNAMMEWPKIWLKIVPDATKDNKQADIFISNEKVDENYTDFAYHNTAGTSVDHFYTAIYNGSNISSKLRSLSGQQVNDNTTLANAITYAKANNPSGTYMWNIELISDIDLINILLVLISKSTNSRKAFGQGLQSGGSQSVNRSFRTGVHNKKGLFYGTNSGTGTTYSNAVKVFGMENWWGFQWRRYLGEVFSNGVRKRKLTYGTEDGSTVTDFNTNGEGYVNCQLSIPSGSNAAYVKEVIFSSKGIMPQVVGATSSTYYSDGIWFNEMSGSSGNYQVARGATSDNGERDGIFSYYYHYVVVGSNWNFGDSLSCKPLP